MGPEYQVQTQLGWEQETPEGWEHFDVAGVATIRMTVSISLTEVRTQLQYLIATGNFWARGAKVSSCIHTAFRLVRTRICTV